MPAANDNLLGTYLKDRRAKLDPSSFGLPLTRRRTPGLRREEVAQRAKVSATWYTGLEQGRGGAPSADVLDRISRAMMLTDAEREHLFLLGLGRPPEVRYHAPEGITPRLQRLLDTLEYSPAFIRTATWDVIAWNKAAAAVLTDYSTLAEGQRNVLRMMFRDARVRAAQPNWQSVARYVGLFPRRCGARGRRAQCAIACRRTVRDQSRIRGHVARQRCAGARRRQKSPAPSHRRAAVDGIFRLRGRWPARSQHGGLQPRDACGCGQDQDIAQIPALAIALSVIEHRPVPVVKRRNDTRAFATRESPLFERHPFLQYEFDSQRRTRSKAARPGTTRRHQSPIVGITSTRCS